MPDERINDVTSERLQISRGITDVVKQATSILQAELADSAGESRKMQSEFATTKKVDPDEFRKLSTRVRKDVHDLIAMAGEMFAELKNDEVQSMVSRMAKDAHEVVETAMNLVDNTPSAAGRAAFFGFTTPPPGSGPVSPVGDPPDPGPDFGPDLGNQPSPPNT